MYKKSMIFEVFGEFLTFLHEIILVVRSYRVLVINIFVCNLQTSQVMPIFSNLRPVISEILGRGGYHPLDASKLSKRADAINR